jgi:hypothetical protein
LAGGNQPLSLFDTQFAAVASLGQIPCAAAGQNAVALTPFANTPTISSYADLAPSFVFAAAQTSNASVTLNVSLAGARNAYKWNGLQACGAGDLIAGQIYRAVPLQALNGGVGGFVVDAYGVQANIIELPFTIDGGGSALTTGLKGFVPIPVACTIVGFSLIADQVGSIAMDIWRANNAVPVIANSIVGGTKPNLTASQLQTQIPPGIFFTATALAANDYLAFSVFSTSGVITRLTTTLFLAKI